METYHTKQSIEQRTLVLAGIRPYFVYFVKKGDLDEEMRSPRDGGEDLI